MIRKIRNKAKRLIHKLLVDNNLYYNQLFKDCRKFWNFREFNLNIVNLGSNSALYGFDYSVSSLKGANWAMGPQSLNQDLAILKTYYSFIGPRGTVLVPLCPYSSCLKSYKDTEILKYYTILHPGVIEDFSFDKQKEAYLLKLHPYKYAPKQMIKGLLKSIMKCILHHKQSETKSFQPLSDDQLKNNAKSFVEGWKKQFNITDMDAFIPEHIQKGRKIRVSTLKELIQFCEDRELNYYIVIPPVTQFLSSYFSETFKQNYIYSFLEEVGVKKERVLDYLTNQDFQDKELYFNSFFLNKRGRELFTHRILKDINFI